VHRTQDVIPVEEGRFLASHIPSSRFRELAGVDHGPWVGDSQAVINEIERFLVSLATAPGSVCWLWPAPGTVDWRLDTLTWEDADFAPAVAVHSWGDKMHFVVLGTHSAEVCPTSNAKTKAVLLEIGPQVANLAEKHGVNIVAGPFANREHMLVVIVETDRPEALDSFLVESRLSQWNQLRILPSLPIQDAMQELQEAPPLF
jgi:uncharacterized protein with GYD domain